MSKNWDNKALLLAQSLAPPLMSQNPSEPAGQTLWETVQSLHAVVEASPVAIIALDGEGRVKMWNHSAERIFGWAENEVIGHANPTIPPGREEEFRSLVQSRMQGATQAGFETIRLRKDGTARVECGTQDIGTGTYTILAQLASERTGVPLDKIEVALGDTSLPEGPLSGGSMVTGSVVPAVFAAADSADDLFPRVLAVEHGGGLFGCGKHSKTFGVQSHLSSCGCAGLVVLAGRRPLGSGHRALL